MVRLTPEMVIARVIDACPLGEAKKLEKQIAAALREAGYLKDEPAEDGNPVAVSALGG